MLQVQGEASLSKIRTTIKVLANLEEGAWSEFCAVYKSREDFRSLSWHSLRVFNGEFPDSFWRKMFRNFRNSPDHSVNVSKCNLSTNVYNAVQRNFYQ